MAEIPWGQNIALFQKVKDPIRRLWYAKMTFERGWSLPVLIHNIESRLYESQGQAFTNFKATLPPPQSDLAQQALKDPYTFDFMTLAAGAKERELELGLILCKSKRKLSAEHALRDIRKPIGIAAWKTKLERSLPKGFKGQLPSIADLERKIGATEVGLKVLSEASR